MVRSAPSMFHYTACRTCQRPLFRDEPRECKVCWLVGMTRWMRVFQCEPSFDQLRSYLGWRMRA